MTNKKTRERAEEFDKAIALLDKRQKVTEKTLEFTSLQANHLNKD